MSAAFLLIFLKINYFKRYLHFDSEYCTSVWFMNTFLNVVFLEFFMYKKLPVTIQQALKLSKRKKIIKFFHFLPLSYFMLDNQVLECTYKYFWKVDNRFWKFNFKVQSLNLTFEHSILLNIVRYIQYVFHVCQDCGFSSATSNFLIWLRSISMSCLFGVESLETILCVDLKLQIIFKMDSTSQKIFFPVNCSK